MAWKVEFWRNTTLAWLYYWITCIREKVEVPVSLKLHLTFFHLSAQYSVYAQCRTVCPYLSSQIVNMSYLSISGQIVPKAFDRILSNMLQPCLYLGLGWHVDFMSQVTCPKFIINFKFLCYFCTLILT